MAASLPQSKMESQAFSLFPRFPIVIRLKIWEIYTMLHPRIVEICLMPKFDRYDQRNTDLPFYTPTALPKSLFNIDRESRSIAIKNYPLGFPNAHHPAQIRWNTSIDTIFLPAWCFQHQCNDFMEAITEEKGLLQKLAFETLIWMGSNDDGMINNYIQIDDFRNLREVVLVKRLPDYSGCGCCHEFDGPEGGVVVFKELENDDDYGSQYEKIEGRESHELTTEQVEETEAGETWGNEAGEAGENSPDGEVDVERQQERKRPAMSVEYRRMFIAIHEKDPGWKIPSIREVDLTRDGEMIQK